MKCVVRIRIFGDSGCDGYSRVETGKMVVVVVVVVVEWWRWW